MALNQFQTSNLALGLNTKTDLYSLREGESPDAVNILPGGGGATIKRRNGLSFLSNSGIAGGPDFRTLYPWLAQDLLLVSATNDVYSVSSSFVWTQRFNSAYAGNAPWQFEIAKDLAGNEYVWMLNGQDAPQKWRGPGFSANTLAWAGGIPPAGCTFLRLWKNRMVAGGNPAAPERLYYSDIGNPELPNPWNFIDLRSSYDDSDALTWAELSGDNLLVFKQNSTWLIYDSNTFANQRLGYPGVPHENLTASLNGIIYLVNQEGFWVTNGSAPPEQIPMKVDPIDFPGGLDDGLYTRRSQLIADEREQRLLFLRVIQEESQMWAYYPPGTLNNPHKEGTWWLQQWSAFDNQIMAIAVAPRVALPSRILGLAKESACLYEVFGNQVDEDVYADESDQLDARWASWVLQLNALEKFERIRRLNLRITEDTIVELDCLGPVVQNQSFEVDNTDDSGFVRLRPEMRGREFQLTVKPNLTHPPLGTPKPPLELRDIEIMYRGGKEIT